MAKILGAKVIGLASAANHTWLADHGVIPVAYGEGVADRIRAASGGKVDAFIDTFGGGNVELALELGVAPDRIDTISDFAAAAKHGVKTEGNSAGANAKVSAELRQARFILLGGQPSLHRNKRSYALVNKKLIGSRVF